MTHTDLVNIAYKWILNVGRCGVAFKGFHSLASNGEYPDVIGFNSWGFSILIECKTSRQDFLSDNKKKFRVNPDLGMGSERFYCCPTGLIKVSELPRGVGFDLRKRKRKN